MAGSGYKIAVLIIIQADSLLSHLRLFCKYAVTLFYFILDEVLRYFCNTESPDRTPNPFNKVAALLQPGEGSLGSAAAQAARSRALGFMLKVFLCEILSRKNATYR